MPRTIVSVSSKPKVHDPVQQKEASALQLPFRIEIQHAARTSSAIPRYRSRQYYRPAEFFCASRDVQSVQPL